MIKVDPGSGLYFRANRFSQEMIRMAMMMMRVLHHDRLSASFSPSAQFSNHLTLYQLDVAAKRIFLIIPKIKCETYPA